MRVQGGPEPTEADTITGKKVLIWAAAAGGVFAAILAFHNLFARPLMIQDMRDEFATKHDIELIVHGIELLDAKVDQIQARVKALEDK